MAGTGSAVKGATPSRMAGLQEVKGIESSNLVTVDQHPLPKV